MPIGIENYETAIGQAIYAENDSKAFREFAINNLGIYENNIKYLSGSIADEKAILLSVKKWLRRLIKKEKHFQMSKMLSKEKGLIRQKLIWLVFFTNREEDSFWQNVENP